MHEGRWPWTQQWRVWHGVGAKAILVFETERLAFRLCSRTLTPQMETGERGLTLRDPLSPPPPTIFGATFLLALASTLFLEVLVLLWLWFCDCWFRSHPPRQTPHEKTPRETAKVRKWETVVIFGPPTLRVPIFSGPTLRTLLPGPFFWDLGLHLFVVVFFF